MVVLRVRKRIYPGYYKGLGFRASKTETISGVLLRGYSVALKVPNQIQDTILVGHSAICIAI